ncbi:hypothetical protein [uncultured Gammaproteobacteria bacterium]|nr:hypothetical protein [uncultured Gammaproteobacteria bacterium]
MKNPGLVSNKKKIFFATQSWHKSKGANYIQVKQMIKAFSKQFDIVYVILRTNLNSENFFTDNVNSHVINMRRCRLCSIIYTLQTLLAYIKQSRGGNFSLVYSRNILFSFLVSRLTICNHGLELHAGVRSKLEAWMLRKMYKKKVVLFCISESLQEHIRGVIGSKKGIISIPDAHNFPSLNREVYTKEILSKEVINVGYFGKLSPQKGLATIVELLRIANKKKIQFNIFTPDERVLGPSDSLGVYEYIDHDQCMSRMLEQDILLLLIEPQGGIADISPYTSPLKLFEYMAIGKPIIASNLPILREILTSDKDSILVENSAEKIIKVILDLKDKSSTRDLIARNAKILAKKHTWDNRINKINKSFKESVL